MEQLKGSRPFCSLSKRGEEERERGPRVPTQASFSSSETLQALEPGAHLLLGARGPQPPSRDNLEPGPPGRNS
ncbi:hypothetical protein NHX12_010974 [Muraenolepis orangiensis]|uniref:Uncharacterized protein n=1 Tax=Muraenolepis orangiensis TaxID=630683 RepID=A0A9Q0DFG5_9TELE|nr:hypothetical protein NHX12_010974 [Muraenolepis orangiensis]